MATKLRLHKTDLERIQREQEEEAQAQAQIEEAADTEISTIAETWGLDPREVEVVLKTKYRPLFIRARQAQRDIEKRGLVSFDNYGRSRTNPSVTIEKDSIQAMARLLKLLNIGFTEPEPAKKARPWENTR
jgi:phage terminase small subunit